EVSLLDVAVFIERPMLSRELRLSRRERLRGIDRARELVDVDVHSPSDVVGGVRSPPFDGSLAHATDRAHGPVGVMNDQVARSQLFESSPMVRRRPSRVDLA